MTTATQALQQYIGKQAMIQYGTLSVLVNITDAKNSYGQDRLQITPVAGSGATWVNLSSLMFADRKDAKGGK